ncbi:MAG: DUF47 family protein [Saccharofermentans sp.]|nr:DUF47 family protein [Saccharofermentans sp.]
MKDTDRESIYSYIFSVCEILKKEGTSFLEVLDYPEDVEEISRRVSALEEEADSVFHDIVILYQNGNLARDPEAQTLLEVAKAVEDCTDAIQQLAMDFYRYNITEIRDEIYTLLISISKASNKLSDLIVSLRKMDNLNPPIKYIVELDSFKVDFLKIYDENIRRLFTSEENPIEIIRWKSIYESFKTTFQAFENVADTSAKVIFFKNS